MPVFLYLSQKKVTHQEPAAEVILVEGLKKKKKNFVGRFFFFLIFSLICDHAVSNMLH